LYINIDKKLGDKPAIAKVTQSSLETKGAQSSVAAGTECQENGGPSSFRIIKDMLYKFTE